MPKRIQLRRAKGWHKPPNTITVARPTRWGNPFSAAEYGHDECVALYEKWIHQPAQRALLADARKTLRGKNLACWCHLDQTCHAEILLRLVNE